MLELIPHIVLLVVKGDKSAIRAAMTIYFSVILHPLEHVLAVLAIHTTVVDSYLGHFKIGPLALLEVVRAHEFNPPQATFFNITLL